MCHPHNMSGHPFGGGRTFNNITDYTILHLKCTFIFGAHYYTCVCIMYITVYNIHIYICVYNENNKDANYTIGHIIIIIYSVERRGGETNQFFFLTVVRDYILSRLFSVHSHSPVYNNIISTVFFF